MDIVKQNRDFGFSERDDINSKILNSSLTDDYFLGRICNREIEKLNNLSIDNQLMSFMKLAVFHNGYIHSSNLYRLFDDYRGITIDDISNLFKGHTLISVDSDIISFKYDFFKEFFINLYICNFLIEKNIDNIDHNLEKLISEYIKYDTSFTKKICQRVTIDEDFQIFIIELIELFIDKLKNNECIKSRKMISSLVCILLSKKQADSNQNNNYEILNEVFGVNLNYLSLVNFVSKDSDKITFDFRDKDLTNIWFDNYPFFWECKFNENTKFIKSTFNHLEPMSKIKIPNSMFIECDTTGINNLIKSSNDEHIEKNHSITNDIKRIFRLFDTSGTFKEQKKEYIEKHADSVILKKLLKHKIITPYKNPQKPKIRQFRVSDEYYNIIKILDQNGSNYELVKIINLINS